MPQTPYDAVLHAARDVTRMETALDAELLGAALLGSVYAVAGPGRADTVREFVAGFLAATARRRTAAARAIRSVFAALAPDVPGAAKVRPGPDPPRWGPQLGRVRVVDTWAYGDVYGDQTTYLATFEYHDPELGGDEHAVVALVDHNIGIVKDLFVGRPARVIRDEVRKAVEADELIWWTQVDPGTLRAQVSFHLEITDGLSVLPDEGTLATDRALVAARLAALPATGAPPAAAQPPADPVRLTSEFLSSPQAAELDRSGERGDAEIRYVVRLIMDFAQDSPDCDPLRWSPAVAGLFLLDWVHRRAVLDDDDVAMLPPVLRAWVAWAAARRGLPVAAAEGTYQSIHTMVPEFARRHRTGEGGGQGHSYGIPRPR
jgi:hypothetical protein